MKLKASTPTKKNSYLSQMGSIVGLILIVVLATIVTKGAFLKHTNLTNVFRQVTIMGFASLGMCIVILTGNIDLSVIGNVSMTSCITAVMMVHKYPTAVIVLTAIAAGVLVGIINGLLLSIWKIEAFVVTMGMQVVCFGMAMVVSGNMTVIVPGDTLSTYTLLTGLAQWKLTVIPGVLTLPVMFLIMLGFYLLFWVFTTRTKMGRYIYALGGNEEVCYISGVNITVIRILVYALSGLTAAVAGIFMFSRSLCGDPSCGESLGMYVVAAVVVGGTKMSGGRGNVLFTIMGIFVIGIINNVLNLIGAPYQLQQVIQGVIIIVAVIMSSPRRK